MSLKVRSALQISAIIPSLAQMTQCFVTGCGVHSCLPSVFTVLVVYVCTVLELVSMSYHRLPDKGSFFWGV